jgi:sulfhydrogenase subunit beta (sulfur reductase)
LSTGYILANDAFRDWLNILRNEFTVIGPVLKKRGPIVFEEIQDAGDLHLDYCSTMLGPRKFIYPPTQRLFRIDNQNHRVTTIEPADAGNAVIFAVRPCDMQAISVLDRTFLGDIEDFYYRKLREETLTVVLNCNRACDAGFCESMGAGPFLRLEDGYDLEMTSMGENYLIEIGSRRGEGLIEKAVHRKEAASGDFGAKDDLERKAIASFTKHLETAGLPELLMRNLDHPVYRETAEARCLGCTNCTMVCPTCYCYDIEDDMSFDLTVTERRRHWDSCQELHFARVHGGNFRSSREARLRQFVTHKLATWVEQYGCFGCVGCGRCMTWCPTGIDLTEMAKRIQQDFETGRARWWAYS